MKKIVLTLIGYTLGVVLTTIGIKGMIDNSGKPISYPEEIQIAKPGDTLIVYSVKDSIYIGFKNKR
jgi:ABC-type transporter lipoprotein component MlaA